MKIINKSLAIVLALIGFSFSTQAQSPACAITKNNGMGYTTTLNRVVNNCNGTYTIEMILNHNGCGGPSCKELSHLSFEAAPGSYSAISSQVVSGNFKYTNLALGPNLGSDPFQGFKFDGASDIGGGQAGSVKITYTLTSLQQQRVSAKAGTAGNIVTFTLADFNYVMTCNSTNCSNPGPTDTDNDGCIDADDAYPNDPARCSNTTQSGTLAFEDLWPSKGDFDFNDLVIEYNLKSVKNSTNKVIDIEAKFTIKAFGASFKNGFGFQLPNDINQNHLSVTGMQINGNVVSLGANGLENGQSKPTFIVFDNNYMVMQHPGSGIGVNTTPGAPYVAPVTITLNISVQPNTYTMAQLGIANFNPFIFVNQVRSHEIHLPNYAPTSLMNMSLLGTNKDASNAAQGKYYVTSNNLPWALHLPVTNYKYAKEKVDVLNAHLKFEDWAESSGSQYADWYMDMPGYRNNSNLY